MSDSPKRLALKAALRFLKLSASWAQKRGWRMFCTVVEFDLDEPTFSSKRYPRNPEIHMHLRPDWMTAVHLRGFDRLPVSPGAGIFGDQILILHVGEAHFVRDDQLVAPAIWTRGRQPARGFIAWRRDSDNPGMIAAWAVGRSAVSSQDQLALWQAPHRIPGVDAEAMSRIEF